MKYQELFDHCYGRKGESSIRVNEYIVAPENLDTLGRVSMFDESAARAIREFEHYAELLKDYRLALAARYAELAAMPYCMRLEYIRDPAFRGGVTYRVRLLRVYQDGRTEPEYQADYPGNERHKAAKDFERLCRERPGIEIVKDLAKKRWEK